MIGLRETAAGAFQEVRDGGDQGDFFSRALPLILGFTSTTGRSCPGRTPAAEREVGFHPPQERRAGVRGGAPVLPVRKSCGRRSAASLLPAAGTVPGRGPPPLPLDSMPTIAASTAARDAPPIVGTAWASETLLARRPCRSRGTRTPCVRLRIRDIPFQAVHAHLPPRPQERPRRVLRRHRPRNLREHLFHRLVPEPLPRPASARPGLAPRPATGPSSPSPPGSPTAGPRSPRNPPRRSASAIAKYTMMCGGSLPPFRFAPLPVASTASSTASRGTQDASTPREIQSLKRPSATLPRSTITRDHAGDQPKDP